MGSEELFASIPSGWEYKTLSAACAEGGGDIQTGPFGSQLHAADYVPIGIPSIMPQNIGDNRIHEEGIARITPEDARRLSRYLVRTGDIVYSRRGDVERRALVRAHEDGWLCGTGCLRVRLGDKGADTRFVSHYLGHPSVREWIVRHAHGATMPNLNTSILGACPFLEPPIEEQRAIAHILGTLDDKIELNRKQNETLEAMARALFKAWFVDFEPVRAKMEGRWQRDEFVGARHVGARHAVPLPAHLYDLFPDRLVESELGEIPEGWEVGRLGDVAEHPRRGIQPEAIKAGTPYIALEHIPRRSIALNSWGVADDLESNKYEFKKGEILFGKLRPYFHKVGIAPLDGVCSTDIVVIAAKSPDWLVFVLALVSSDEFVEYTNAGSTGTKMPRTSWTEMVRYQIALPPDSLASEFNAQIEPMTETVIGNIHESRSLAQLRDTLLPKLISGELRIKDAEAFLKERGL